jgi:hypothetical protein
MSYSTIRRIQAVIQNAGMSQAIQVARGYGVTNPAEFVLWFVAKPGQAVKVRS